jgi:hypothetical protein
MSLEGYTGPTSGRITVGGGKPSEIKRFYDEPLTRDELAATRDFRALSPHEQIREVRRLKWNAEERARQVQELLDAQARMTRELYQAHRELATRRPDGYEIPRAAADLMAHALEYGWGVAKEWSEGQTDLGSNTEPWYRLAVEIRDMDGTSFKLTWSVPLHGEGAGRMVRRGLYRRLGSGWQDAPSLTKIKKIIEEKVFG